MFLAHLIATAQKAPQTRQRRTAEPMDVARLYTATALRVPLSARTQRSSI
jgi:hypothetical protein